MTSETDTRRAVLSITLDPKRVFPGVYESFNAKLKSRSKIVIEAETSDMALKFLKSGRIDTVLFMEPTLINDWKKHRTFAEALAVFTANGGTTIFAAQCSRDSRAVQIKTFFKEIFEVGWEKSASYKKGDWVLNIGGSVPFVALEGNAYNVKALCVKGVKEGDVLYGSQYVGKDEGAVILAEYRRGVLGWMGDVCNEEATQEVVLRMCGL